MRDSVDKVADICIILGAAIVVALKIQGVIKISWFWLLCPIWGLFGLGLIFSLLFIFIYFFGRLFDKEKKDERY